MLHVCQIEEKVDVVGCPGDMDPDHAKTGVIDREYR